MITFPMKTIQKSLLTLLFLTFLQFSFAQSSVDVKLYPSEKAPQISKHIYGHFAEHLGQCIYGGIYVGENAQIANTRGFRNDVINALVDMKNSAPPAGIV